MIDFCCAFINHPLDQQANKLPFIVKMSGVEFQTFLEIQKVWSRILVSKYIQKRETKYKSQNNLTYRFMYANGAGEAAKSRAVSSQLAC